MTARFGIALDTALHLVAERLAVPDRHALVAPSLLRSQMVSKLYAEVQAGRMERAEADARLDRMRGLKIRLLGDRVLQRRAWAIADALGWSDTLDAEYIAVTALQADAFVTLDPHMQKAAAQFVATASLDDLLTG